jgi:pimeloyl-ACP methyl ester carboxylesterase
MGKAVEDLSEGSRTAVSSMRWQAYWKDAAQRAVLTMDVLRQRGDIFLEHEEAGCPPVLIYDYDVVMDGADLPRPCCYQLLRIKCAGWASTVRLSPGNGPISSSTRAPDMAPASAVSSRTARSASPCAAAIRSISLPSGACRKRGRPWPTSPFRSRVRAQVMEEHPDAPNPIITGNCQGGWAALLLAATNPDLTGPVVLNGAPVSTWVGRVGDQPDALQRRRSRRHLERHAIPILATACSTAPTSSRISNAQPRPQLFRQVLRSLFQGRYRSATGSWNSRRWWGGYFLLNEAEMKWIVEQLFVGNKLPRTRPSWSRAATIDIKQIRAPIIVFASWGDNITPPQQALNWIIDTYTDEREIAIRGQRIIYMVHDQVGHLGIFVSSKIAKKEHTEVTSTLKTIEALAPGLYEMTIDDYEGRAA